MSKLQTLFEQLNLHVKNLHSYEVAFTHSSCRVSETHKQDYEKLEFMGDAVISFVVASLIYKLHSQTLDQGKMTKMRSELVQKKALARYARALGLDQYIQFGPQIKENEKDNDRFLEDVFEAFVGALYIDLGIQETSEFLMTIFKQDILEFSFEVLTDYKGELQEAMQAENREALHYYVIKEEGPAHDKTYTVEVHLEEICLGTGVGKTKKAAEQNAAKSALNKKAG